MTPMTPPPMTAYDVRATTVPTDGSLVARRIVGAAIGAVLMPLGLAALGIGLSRYRNELVRTLPDETITAGFGFVAIGALFVAIVFLAGRALSASTTAVAAVVSIVPALVFYADPLWTYRNLPDELLGERFAAQYVFETGVALALGVAAAGATIGRLVRAPRTVQTSSSFVAVSPPPPPPPF
jgi:hypothetical protein